MAQARQQARQQEHLQLPLRSMEFTLRRPFLGFCY
jgi:hypothetical protein